MELYLYAALCWFVSGIAGGATSMGTVMVAVPLMTLFLPPADCILIACLVGAASVFQLAAAYRRHFSWKDIRGLVIGTVPGALAGTAVLKVAPVGVLQLMVSLILAVFVAMKVMGVSDRFRLPAGEGVALAAGTVCGFVGSSVSMSGAPLGVYVLLRGWEPDRVRGNVSLYYFFSAFPIIIMQFAAGLYTLPVAEFSAAGLAGVLAGQQLGIVLGRRLGTVLFFRLIVGFLSLASVILFLRAVS